MVNTEVSQDFFGWMFLDIYIKNTTFKIKL